MANDKRDSKLTTMARAPRGDKNSAIHERGALLDALDAATVRVEAKAYLLGTRLTAQLAQADGDARPCDIERGYLEATQASVAASARDIAARVRRIASLVREQDKHDAELLGALLRDAIALGDVGGPAKPVGVRKATPVATTNAPEALAAPGRRLRSTARGTRVRESYRVRGA
jgi:hypothetical protein